MPRPCCEPDYDAVFGPETARRELAGYRRNGPSAATRRLLDGIRDEGVAGATVLDIGGGVGVIGFELLDAGALHFTDVDAAGAYLAAARSESERRGVLGRSRFVRGDFVALASEIEDADIVTLDRVVCCYGDWRALIDHSTAHARRLYGLVYPVDRWWLRLAIRLQNGVMALIRRRLRFHVHPERELDARIRGHGFRAVRRERGLVWQSVLYARTG